MLYVVAGMYIDYSRKISKNYRVTFSNNSNKSDPYQYFATENNHLIIYFSPKYT